MKAVSVIIGTVGRPQFLQTALASVARQSAVGEIEEVVVSENLNDRSSEAVCAGFNNLPIKYIFQDPPVSAQQHGHILFQEAKAEHVAILYDDDWWEDSHIQRGLRALRNDAKASAYVSAGLTTRSEDDYWGELFRCPVIKAAAENPDCRDYWKLDTKDALALLWIFMPFPCASAIIRRDILRSESHTLLTDKGASFTSDRVLCAYIAKHGSIIFDPSVGVYSRVHGTNGMATLFSSRKLLSIELVRCAGIVYDLAESLGHDPLILWRGYIDRLSKGALEQVLRYLSVYPRSAISKERTLRELVDMVHRRTGLIRAKNMVKNILPPAIWELCARAAKRRWR